MAGDWRPANWGEEVSLEYGKAIRGYSPTHGKYRVFGSNGPIGWTSEALTQGPGVILGRKGAYRGVEYWREPFWVIDTAYYLVPKTELDMRWLYYAIKHYKLGEIDDGSPIPSTTRAAVYMLELDVPPKPEQRAIAHVLGTLDDKIELNRRRNQTLEAMARALFKDWFVDFGPVRAKMQLPSPSGRGVGGEGSNPQPRRKLPLPDTIRQHAAELRRNATDAENLLWRLLRNQQLANAKFRRQHAVPPYILDFYCNELKLAVELDGGQHNQPTGRAHDARRTEYLHARGIEVLRFWNHDVLRDTEAVLEAIYQAIEANRVMAPSPPAPLPGGEGGKARSVAEGEGSKTRSVVEGEGSKARSVVEGEGSKTHDPAADALEPFSLREKGWDEGAYLPPELWNLFPDRLDDDGKPVGWEMQPLSELLTIIGGGTPKTSVEDYWGGDIPWFSVVDTPSASDVFVVATEKTITSQGLATSSARLIPKGTTIISARGTVGNLAIAGRDMTFNQSCYALQGTKGVGDYFGYLTAQQMVDQLKSMAHGSVFSTITRQTFEAIQRPVPPPGILTAFEGLVSGWFDAILSSVEESRTLAQLRDTLLPKLISGELRIADAEAFMERVA